MDPSSLIFVALAIAWAAYLVPKAVKHHDEVVRSRSVDRFSQTMRVLARREPVSRRNARLVVSPGRSPSVPIVSKKTTSGPAPATPAPARPAPVTARAAAPVSSAAVSSAAAKAATRRRRRVLGLILLALVVVVALAAFQVLGWGYVVIPTAVLVAWLVACRLMVRSERRSLRSLRESVGGLAQMIPSPREDDPDDDGGRAPKGTDGEQSEVAAGDEVETDAQPDDDTSTHPAITDPAMWDPVPVTLPTYVNKPAAARRTVRTIELDATGVWTSGRTEADSALAREADEADQAARAARTESEQRRASGS